MKPLFFKAELSEDAEEFRQYLPVNVNTDFDVLAPAIADAERKHIVPVLGGKLASELHDYYISEGERDAKKDAVIERIQSASIRIAYYESFDLLTVNITDTGLQDLNGENRVYRYQADRAKDTLSAQACEHLQYFYEELVQSGLRHWEPSDPYNPTRQSSLFRSYQDFFHVVKMEFDFRLWSKLASWIDTSEKTYLPYHVGSEIAMALLNREERVSGIMLPLAQRAVAYNALAEALPVLNGHITVDGLTVRSMRPDGSNAGFSQQAAEAPQRKELALRYQKIADSAIVTLVELLRHSGQFPEIAKVVTRDNVRTNLPSHGKKSYRL